MERRERNRRARRTGFHWPERRTGFDRRSDCTVRLLRESSALLIALLALLNLLNVLDWRFTAIGLERGAIEANPIMAAFFGVDTLAAGLFKVSWMFAISVIIWHARRYRRVLEFTVVAAVMYFALVLYHIVGLNLILPSG